MGMNLLLLVAIVVIVFVLALALRGKSPAPNSTEPSVIEAFRKEYRQQWLVSIPTAAFVLWVFERPSSGGALHGLLLVTAAAVVAGVGLFTYRNWRCPKCGAYLGRHPLYTGTCPNCGTALREPRA